MKRRLTGILTTFAVLTAFLATGCGGSSGPAGNIDTKPLMVDATGVTKEKVHKAFQPFAIQEANEQARHKDLTTIRPLEFKTSKTTGSLTADAASGISYGDIHLTVGNAVYTLDDLDKVEYELKIGTTKVSTKHRIPIRWDQDTIDLLASYMTQIDENDRTRAAKLLLSRTMAAGNKDWNPE